MKLIRYCFISFLLFISISKISISQEKEKFFGFGGNMSLSYGFYDFNAKNYNSFRPRYEQNLIRFNANMNVKLGKYFSIPFGINVSNQRTSYNLPNMPNQEIFSLGYIQNPRNNIHIDPTYKWFTGHIGSHTPDYSPLTSGDIQIFGVGFDINPGNFILSANYGKSQIAVEPNALLNIPGSYKQLLFGTQIGYGKKDGSKIVLNFLMIKDDTNSLVNRPIGIDPREGVSISPLIEVKLSKTITLKTETAGSIYTKNSLSDVIPTTNDLVNTASKYISLNSSSAIDFGHTTSIEWKAKKISLGGEVNYIGPGFVPVGYFGIETDILDYKVNTGLRLFKNKLTVSGSFGIRTNNLQNTILQSTKRIIGNANVSAEITKSFSINANYNNFSFTNNQNINTLRIELLNSSFSVSPSYKFGTKNKQHILMANYSLNNFDQFDVATSDFTNTNSQTVNANYILIFKNTPLNLGASVLYLQNKSATNDLEINNLSVNASYKLFKKKLKPSIALIYSTINTGLVDSHKRFNIKLKAKYKVNKKLNMNFSFLLNNNNYGSIRPGARLNENRFNISINQKI